MEVEEPNNEGLKPCDKKDRPAVDVDAGAEELALRAQEGSQESFAELVRRFGGRLLLFMQHKTGNLHDAEDLVQDTFVQAYRNINMYRASYKFSTWLYTIASHLATSHYRKLKLHVDRQVATDDNNPLDAAIEKETSCDLWSLAGGLPDNQYQALWLKYVEGMSIKEISAVMGKSQINIKVILYRARVNLAGKKFKN
jgi:RNA polymerase sigma-70 factor, ECF subfamily